MRRVLSLLASSTEIVCALGCREWLIGRSHECDFPPEILALPQCSIPQFVPADSSLAIDSQIKERLAKALSIYAVDPEMLAILRPEIIITQTQCEVCAVSLKDVQRAVAEVTGFEPEIVALSPNSLDDVWMDIERIAVALGVEAAGDKLTSQMKSRMAEISQLASHSRRRPTVATIEWIEPLMCGGNWMPTLVEAAAGVNLLGKAGEHSPWMSFSDLAITDPDIILVLPCGFDLSRTTQEMGHLTKVPGWKQLRAVRDGRVYLCDGNQYFNRPGPRLVESLQILAEIFHPEIIKSQFYQSGWIRAH